MQDFSTRSLAAKDWATFFSNQPTVREIIGVLGLPPVASRGIPKFSEPELQERHSEVQKLSNMLPTSRDNLLQFAASRISWLNDVVDNLLCTFGPRIWGQAADRARLLADPGTLRRRHRKMLMYEDPSDQQVVRNTLRKWVFRKAWNRANSKQPARHAIQGHLVEATLGGEAGYTGATADSASLESVCKQPAETHQVSRVHELSEQDFGRNSPVAHHENGSPVGERQDERSCHDPTASALSCLTKSSPPHPTSSPKPNRVGDACLTPRTTSTVETIRATPTGSRRSSLRGTTPVASVTSRTSESIDRTQSAEPTAGACGRASSEPHAALNASGKRTTVPDPMPKVATGSTGSGNNTQPLPQPPFYVYSVAGSKDGMARARPPPHYPVTGRVTAPQRQAPITPTVLFNQAAPSAYFQSRAPAAPNGLSEHKYSGMPSSARSMSRRLESSTTCGVTVFQCELFSLLLQHLFSRSICGIDEPLLLRRLACEWDAHEKELARTLRQLYAAHRQALFEWRELRLKIIQLQTMSPTRPNAQSSDMVQRLLDLNDIRALHVKWKASGVCFASQNLTSEDLLCGAFALVTNTKGTEPLFKEGLRKLEADTFKVMQLDNLSICLYP